MCAKNPTRKGIEAYFHKFTVKIRMLLYNKLSIPITLGKGKFSFTILCNCLSGRIMVNLSIIQSKEKQIPLNTYTNLRMKTGEKAQVNERSIFENP